MNTASFAATLQGASKRYGAVTALDGIDLNIERGKVTALLGPNGAGKSTVIALLLGLTRANTGVAELFGASPELLTVKRHIGAMLQTTTLPPALRVGELLQLFSSYYPQPRAMTESAAIAGIEDLLPRLYGQLSGGQQRRVQFALAICGNPELLFVDEPTTGLDIEARTALWASIRAMTATGCTVLLTTHYLEEAEALADRVIVLLRGRVVSVGTVAEIRAQHGRRRIRCLSTLSVAQVKAWPEVTSVVQQEQWLHIEALAAESVVRRLLNEDTQLNGLEVRNASLAEAFVHITQEQA